MSIELAQEELGVIDELYDLVECNQIDELILLRIDKAAQADDVGELKRILERLR